jgi:hypothetical protein
VDPPDLVIDGDRPTSVRMEMLVFSPGMMSKVKNWVARTSGLLRPGVPSRLRMRSEKPVIEEDVPEKIRESSIELFEMAHADLSDRAGELRGHSRRERRGYQCSA